MSGWFPLLSGIAVLLSGCRLPFADDTKELDVDEPAAWAVDEGLTAGPVDASAAWWDAFGDDELSLLVDEALVHNRDLLASAARVDGAAAEARIAGAELYPWLDAGGGASRTKQVFVGLPIPGSSGVQSNYFSSYGVSLDVSWEIDLWGRLAAIRDSASEELVASAADYHAARLSIAAQVSKGWFAWQEALLQEELAENTLTSLERSTAIVRRRYETGRADTLDVHRTRGDLAGSRALVEARRETSERTQRQLEILIGRYPSGGLARDPHLPEVGAPPATGIPSELLRRRPDLIAAEARLRAADYRLYEARTLLYPRLSLSASAGRTSAEVGDLFDSDFSTFSLAANLLQPLFQGGRLTANVDLADARTREIAAAYASAVLGAFSEVEIALAVEDELAGRELHLEDASSEFSRALELARDRYSSGLTDLTTLLDSQRRSLQADSELLIVRFQRLENRIDLHLALGGGIETVEETEE